MAMAIPLSVMSGLINDFRFGQISFIGKVELGSLSHGQRNLTNVRAVQNFVLYCKTLIKNLILKMNGD